MAGPETLIEVRDLATYFHTEDGIAKAVDGVSFHIDKGETLSLVGESGCGKSVTAFSIMRLVPDPPGKIVRGEILMEGRNLIELKESEMRRVRGNKISMVFQEPMTSLNPVFRVGNQIAEAAILHQKISRKEARKLTIEMLEKVEIPAPAERIDEYPHQMSGGMKQRVMIAMALVCKPSLLIADEPTTALDVTIQAQILRLLSDLQSELNMSILLITHDLGVVAEAARRVAVMYAGKIVELAEAETLFATPLHPYTVALMESIPRLGERKQRLSVIPGEVPNPLAFPDGCRFHPRCSFATEKCRMEIPEIVEHEKNHFAACWNIEAAKEAFGKSHAES
ncbi:MAG: ABC transporter ATP-binding protein [Planctomycetota bacterium]|nr:MAG: ABC transporter ATP-binding protein [Planctomycetota bacterium]